MVTKRLMSLSNTNVYMLYILYIRECMALSLVAVMISTPNWNFHVPKKRQATDLHIFRWGIGWKYTEQIFGIQFQSMLTKD